jgi:hypothetical protein
VYIVSIQARGFRDLPSASIDHCSRWMRLRGPGPATTALGDAVELGFAALSNAALARLALRWGLITENATPPEDDHAFPDQLDHCDPIAARALVASDAKRSLNVDLELHLDPPLFGQLRELAAREPRVVTALSERPTIRISVGALFTTTFDALAIHLDDFSVGDQRFPTHGKDRPPWLDRFLRGLRGRFHRFDLGDDAPGQLLHAATSRDEHDAYLAWQSALAPDGPQLRIARGPEDQPVLLGDGLPLRRHGQVGLDRASLAAAIHLSHADILWAESDDPLLQAAVESSPSPLEQVFSVSASGGIEVVSDRPEQKTALQAPRAWGAPRS